MLDMTGNAPTSSGKISADTGGQLVSFQGSPPTVRLNNSTYFTQVIGLMVFTIGKPCSGGFWVRF